MDKKIFLYSWYHSRIIAWWHVSASEVIMEKLLGEGAFGEFYKGVIKCLIVNPKVQALEALCTPVAIKLLKCKKLLDLNSRI